mmetsp:Transcript_10934/g.31344  ORF Transcript_10934/g.31344 Transcript_10934/m.31344 type:complete len:811 (+) Transcript_10934:50-2482(+)|eukprot:CAMPEP_0119557414 /NCGR_PEP_ID=MMETSP1352-20130426/9088_1 /TAXON_ID=265584 /ORGANISM="Stauroneis constricta, Strain CCMP1120" /LENGTH=810 /DNA_ID=CAMNT_0007604517 /DNA_START=464 /DNA_END=2896 /DNA_ORIENTATION=-
MNGHNQGFNGGDGSYAGMQMRSDMSFGATAETAAAANHGADEDEAAATRRQLESISVQDSDALFAMEFSQLSTKERDQVLYDIHGVSDIIAETETPDFVPQRCAMLQAEIQKQLNGGVAENGAASMPNMNSNHPAYAYSLAHQMDPDYVTSQTFLLFFLRSESFDVQKAATRVFGFLKIKLELFGAERLCRPIRYQDLTEADQGVLKSGYLQLLPGRDRAGRAILVLFPGIRGRQRHGVENLRAIFYIAMAALEDVSTQQRGIVIIAYNVGNRSIDHVAAWKNGKLFACLPYRLVALHYCYDNANLRLLLSLTLFDKHTRTRFRHHFGTDMECIYKLMTFGISNEILPVSADGTVNLDNHRSWCAHRQDFDSRVVESRPSDASTSSAAHASRSIDRPQSLGNNEHAAPDAIGITSSAGIVHNGNDESPFVHALNLEDMKDDLPSVAYGMEKVASSAATDGVSHSTSQSPPLPPITQSHHFDVGAPSSQGGAEPPIHPCASSQIHMHAQDKEGTRVVVPGRMDILFGRGRSFQEHPGNLRYSQLIETNREKYDSSKKLEKTALTKHIVQTVQASGGRFLKQDGASWVVVSNETARDKISHGFRNRRAVVTAQSKRQSKQKKCGKTQQNHLPRINGSAAESINSSASIASSIAIRPISSNMSVASASSNNTSTSLSGGKRMPGTVRIDMDSYLQSFSEDDQETNQTHATDFFAGIQQFFGSGIQQPSNNNNPSHMPSISSAAKRLRRDDSSSSTQGGATNDGQNSQTVGFGNGGNMLQPKVSVPETYLSSSNSAILNPFGVDDGSKSMMFPI